MWSRRQDARFRESRTWLTSHGQKATFFGVELDDPATAEAEDLDEWPIIPVYDRQARHSNKTFSFHHQHLVILDWQRRWSLGLRGPARDRP